MNIVNTIKYVAKWVKTLIPVALPRGKTEFENWAKDICDVYGLPDNDSIRFALATMILHKESKFGIYYSKRHFGMLALKGASNQVAAYVMQELKEKQEAAARAHKEAELKAKQEAEEQQAAATQASTEAAAANVLTVPN